MMKIKESPDALSASNFSLVPSPKYPAARHKKRPLVYSWVVKERNRTRWEPVLRSKPFSFSAAAKAFFA